MSKCNTEECGGVLPGLCFCTYKVCPEYIYLARQSEPLEMDTDQSAERDTMAGENKQGTRHRVLS